MRITHKETPRLSLLIKCLTGLIFLWLPNKNIEAQHPFRAGAGAAIVPNIKDAPELNAYLAPSIILSYGLYDAGRFRLSLENETSIRIGGDDVYQRKGLSTSVPLSLHYQMGKLGLKAGSGIAYLTQRVEDQYGHLVSKASGLFADLYLGAGLSQHTRLSQTGWEAQLRLHYIKTLNTSNMDGVMISVLLSFGD